ncbi:MAG: 4Fe-4S dicluster domain-containing protein [Flavobacteriales bacterium]|nr:4Fe-4S dicluster domain-containing protein [Flavobacteriales bacterium]
MDKSSIIFTCILFFALGLFSYNLWKIVRNIRLGKSKNRFDQPLKRTKILLKIAFGQTKLFARPASGILHALVYWGFLVITIGTVEMMVDGIFSLDRSFGVLGSFYDLATASGDVMAVLVLVSCLIFMFRRLFLKIKRLSGKEMKKASSIDAIIALVIIMFLMISLLTMNIGYIGLHPENYFGSFPISNFLYSFIADWDAQSMEILHDISWWTHIMLVLIFLNELPYSKHFHVVMSIPNVYFSNIENLGKMDNMPSVTKEVKLMMDPNADPYATPAADASSPESFGAKDVTDLNWVQLMNAYSCTECGRCTSECPANQTGKLLSPRKIMMDTRQRMKEVGKNIDKHGKDYTDNKSLLNDYISTEELWACTTCNACTQACPLNIDPLSIIVDLRRHLVMEQSSAPTELNMMFNNIENNGAPWQFPAADRLKWKDE